MQLFHLTKLAEIQIAKTVQKRKENNLFGNGMVALGLATSHCWKHWNGKAGTPRWSAPASTIMHSFVGMRLHDGRMPPAKLEVLHLFRWFTHTHPSHTTYHHTTCSHLLFHTQLTPHQSFTISFLFPACPMPSLPFFCCLLEEVDMWGYPVL